MFSVWKKLTSKQDDKPNFPTGVLPIGESMQKKYAKGVQYNMKIIIKGDRNTGKTTLFHRLNGKGFCEDYIPTHEIQVTNVNWNYQGAADIVKVEVWDIVDKGEKKKSPTDALKIINDDDTAQNELKAQDEIALDAELINVYKGTHGVILTMNITKTWTWTYVQRELEKIPPSLPVLVVGNFCDETDHRVVQNDEVLAHIEHLNRPTGSAEVYYTESSMKDGFGLQFTYKFLNMPFLMLQRETLLKQLEANTLEIDETRETLSIHSIDDSGSYSCFKQSLANNNKQNNNIGEEEKVNNNNSTEESIKPNESNHTENNPSSEVPLNRMQPLPPLAKVEIPGKSLPIATVSPTVVSAENTKNKSKSNTKETFNGDNQIANNQNNVASTDTQDAIDGNPDVLEDIDIGQLSSDFLEIGKGLKVNGTNKSNIDSDDDSEDDNPMVAGFEEVYSDDNMATFQHQDSNDGEFEDFSDDERRELEQPNVSLIEKIKAERSANKKSDTDSLTNDLTNNGYDINFDVDISELGLNDVTNDEINQISSGNEKDGIHEILDNPKSDFVSTSTKIVDANDDLNGYSEEDSDEGDNKPNPIVISGCIDVDESSLDYIAKEQNDCEDVPGRRKPNECVKNKNGLNNTAEINLNFELDDLEMFMKNQMDTNSQPDVIEPVEPTKSAVEASVSVKKKKKKKTPDDNVKSTTERKKKKKNANASESNEKVKSIERTGTTKETKKSKVTSQNSLVNVEPEKKKKPKKSRKKESEADDNTNEISELDSFYDGL